MFSNLVGPVIFFSSYISLVTEINTFEFRILQKSPIILVPGFFGSQMEAKLAKTIVNEACRKQSSSFYNIWLNIAYLCEHPDCWFNNMRLIYNNETRKTSDAEGVTLRVPNWGDPSVVEYLDNTRWFVPYYRYLTNMLIEDMGYVSNVSLRAAPYDFRKGPDEHEEFFSKLQKLVEETYEINNKLPVTLISHSMGSSMSLIFLQRQSQSWKDKYVNSLISLAGVWGGSVKALKASAVGENFGIQILLDAKKTKTLLNSYPSLAFLLPSKLFWNDEVLVQSRSKNYTVADLKDYFEQIEEPNLWEFHKNNEKYKLDFTSPGVTVHCLYGTGLPTFEKLYYQLSEVKPNIEPIFIFGSGDGTVNLRSLEGCKHWIGKQKEQIHYQSYHGLGHLGILNNKNVFHYIKRSLTIVDNIVKIDCISVDCDTGEPVDYVYDQIDLDSVEYLEYPEYDQDYWEP